SRARGDIELLPESPLQLSILPEGGARLAGTDIEAHDLTVCLLAEGINVDGPPCVPDSAIELILALKMAHKPGESKNQALVQALLFREDPLFEVAGEEGAAIQLDRPRQELRPLGFAGLLLRRLERVLQLLQICRYQGGVQLHREPVRAKDRVPRAARRV